MDFAHAQAFKQWHSTRHKLLQSSGNAVVRAYKFVPMCALILGCAVGCVGTPSTAFFYGSQVPIDVLSRFDRVVIEGENLSSPARLEENGASVFAYVSVGEAEGWRSSASALPESLFLGPNTAWNSRIADLTQAGWCKYILEERMAVLWESGYRGFFLDTLDSYQLPNQEHSHQRAQSRALIGIIRSMHQRFPGVRLILNRGFDVLPEIGPLAVGLVAESLFWKWDPASRTYVEVSAQDRAWLVARLKNARKRYRLPIAVIDYVPLQNKALARETAARIKALGFAAWISTPALDVIDTGANQ